MKSGSVCNNPGCVKAANALLDAALLEELGDEAAAADGAVGEREDDGEDEVLALDDAPSSAPVDDCPPHAPKMGSKELAPMPCNNLRRLLLIVLPVLKFIAARNFAISRLRQRGGV